MTKVEKVFESTQCLIPGQTQCNHYGCYLTEKQPKYFSEHQSDKVIARKDFTEFRRFKCYSGAYHLMAVNPYTEGTREWHSFEGFRQSKDFELKGRWPANQEVYLRDEVSFVYGEYEIGSRVDIKQFAIYSKDLSDSESIEMGPGTRDHENAYFEWFDSNEGELIKAAHTTTAGVQFSDMRRTYSDDGSSRTRYTVTFPDGTSHRAIDMDGCHSPVGGAAVGDDCGCEECQAWINSQELVNN